MLGELLSVVSKLCKLATYLLLRNLINSNTLDLVLGLIDLCMQVLHSDAIQESLDGLWIGLAFKM